MNNEGSISRRDFVKAASLAATAVTTGLALNPASGSAATTAPAIPMIGFQAEVTYLLQYGIARFLDDVQTRASVNTLMLHGNPFEASWAGLDKATNPTGNFATAHPQYYRDIKMQPQALNPGDFNLPDAMQKITAGIEWKRPRGIPLHPTRRIMWSSSGF